MSLKENNVLDTITADTKSSVAMLFISFFIMYYVKRLGLTVDYPSYSFNFWGSDIAMGLNGVIFLVAASRLISLIPFYPIRRVLIYLGKNTLGILFFHFLGFKAAYIPLYLAKIVPFSYFQNFTPTAEVSNVYWPFIVLISIAFSIAIWNILNAIKPVSILLGQIRVGGNGIIAAKTKELWGLAKNCVKTLYYKLSPYITKLNIVVFTICVAAMIPLYNTGPIVNDELQYRYYRMEGLWSLFNYYLKDRLRQGRPTIIMSSVNVLFSYPTKSDTINGLVQVLLLAVTIMIFGYLIKLKTKNRYFAAFVSIFTAVFMAITFEHNAPMAFWGQLVVLAFYLLVSLVLYVKYLQEGRRKNLIISCIFYVLALLSFEMAITYAPIFVLIAFFHNRMSVKKTIRSSLPHIAIAFIYLGLYVLSQKFVSAEAYAGGTVGFVSLANSWEIIWNLFVSALPGYYMFNSKYQYLAPIYTGYISVYNTLRIIVLAGAVFYTIYRVFGFANKMNEKSRAIGDKKGKSQGIYYLLFGVAILYMFLPSLPNSISLMYQGIVGADKAFVALPVSFFLYFAASLAICSLIWIVVKKINRRSVAMTLAVLLCIFLIPVQYENDEFSNRHNSNLKRLETIESVFRTNTIAELSDSTILTSDIYATRDTLAIHDGYWTAFARNIVGINVEVVKGEEESVSEYDAIIAYPDDKYFIIINGDEVTVLADEFYNDIVTVELPDGRTLTIQLPQSAPENPQEYIDGSFYRYSAMILDRVQ